jgi:hypothetical protein
MRTPSPKTPAQMARIIEAHLAEYAGKEPAAMDRALLADAVRWMWLMMDDDERFSGYDG